MTETVKSTCDQLSDEMEIRSVVHRYADASSRRDPAGVASTLTSDCEWHSPAMGNHQGRDADTWLISRRHYDPLLIRADDTVTALPFPTDVPAID
jgi:ketosteroid isomerase-like protein